MTIPRHHKIKNRNIKNYISILDFMLSGYCHLSNTNIKIIIFYAQTTVIKWFLLTVYLCMYGLLIR